MMVRELVALLQKQNQDAEVRVAVGWSHDTAISDKGEDVQVSSDEKGVLLEGWLSNCGTTLEIGEEEEDAG